MDTELYQEILDNQKDLKSSAPDGKDLTWLIFTAGRDTFALVPEEVREIVRNTEIYPLPFVPPYIKGVLNRHGDPYAVIDVSSFLGHEELSENLFLILNDDNDIAFRISEIREFHTAGEGDIKKIPEVSRSDYFSGAVSYNSITASVLNVTGITGRIRTDLENN
ncbi:MAG: chemotaxis protein CheW [Treponema sp.]